MGKPIDKVIKKLKKYNGFLHEAMAIKEYASKKEIKLEHLINKASQTQDPKLIDQLVKRDLDSVALKIDLALCMATKDNNVELVERCLKMGANPNRKFYNTNALIMATENRQIACINTMLDYGGNPCVKHDNNLFLMAKNEEDIRSAINVAENVAEETGNFDILMVYLSRGNVVANAKFVNTLTLTPFPEESIVETIRKIYNEPEKFLELSDEQILSKNHKYFKQAAYYGFTYEANFMKNAEILWKADISNVKDIVAKINEKISTVKTNQNKKNNLALSKEKEKKQRQIEDSQEQEMLFKEYSESIKSLEK